MTLRWMPALVVALLAVPAIAYASGKANAAGSAEQALIPKTQQGKLSYGIGVELGRGFKRDGIEVELDLLMKGLRDGLSGSKLLMSEEDLHATLSAFQAELTRKQAQARLKVAEENKKAGEAFLAGNAKKEGVVALPSGLQYKILKAGEGKRPTGTDVVECSYRGTLIDGTEFDSSYRTGKPATFRVSGVIRGWAEALKLMPVGSRWQLFIPPQLAYGPRGLGGEVGPNATLIFEVELLAIK